jgi:type I restriction enzyme S subunit
MSGIISWVTSKDLRHRLDADFYRPEYLSIDRRAAAHGLPLRPVVALSSLVTDGTHKTPAYVDFGVPFLSAKNIGDGFVSASSGHKYVSADEFAQLKRWNCAPDEDDVLVAKSGSIGSAGLARGAYPAYAVFESVAIIRPRGVRPAYLSAFLNSRLGQLQIRRHSKGAVIRHLHLEDLRDVEVPLPDQRVQDYIGAKIELAERCRAVSSERWTAATNLLGSALGVPLKPETFEVKSTGDVSAHGYQVASLRPVIARVSPERLEGSIGAQFFTPRRAKAILVIEQSGLKVKRLADLADRFAKRVAADELQRLGLAYVGLAQIDSAIGYISANSDEQPTGSSAHFSAGDILFSKLRPYRNKVAICPDHLENAAGSTELVTYRTKPDVDPYYVYLVLKSPLVLNQVIDITSGSTHPRVDPDLIDDVLVPVVETSAQRKIGLSVRSALELMRRATLLVDEAKVDVEALVEGTLDIEGILSGRIRPPTSASVAELAEVTA